MDRYRDELVDPEFERSYRREDRFERERPWHYNDSFGDRPRQAEYRSERFGRGRFGERADFERDEPRYGYQGRREERYGRADYGRDPSSYRDYVPSRSRLRCRDIMTRELAVATRGSTLVSVGLMMKEEDTGVIPVVETELNGGNGGATATERFNGHGYGKLLGLITDRDVVLRAVAAGKVCSDTQAEEIMSTDLYTARSNDRVVDVLRKMGDKQVRRIPVVSENGNLRGMISLGDIALEMEGDPELAEALEEISKKSSFWSSILR